MENVVGISEDGNAEFGIVTLNDNLAYQKAPLTPPKRF